MANATNKQPGVRQNWRQEVAEEMIRQIEAGTAPWQKPWEPGVIVHQAHNASSGMQYHGINSIWLDMQGFEDPRWLTLKQANAAGASIRQGEKSTQVEYWQWGEHKPVISNDGVPVMGEDGKIKTDFVRLDRPRVFYANVFNAEQIEGLAPYQAPEPKFAPEAAAERLLDLGGIKISHDQSDRAFYDHMRDEIHLPDKAAFESAYEYYATALHELGHASGHKSRLARDFGPFGSEVYAKEELRAELSSYMTARELGLGHFPNRHASYTESWLKALKDDHNLLFQAARDADRIATWVQEPDLRPRLEKEAQSKRKVKTMERNDERTDHEREQQQVRAGEQFQAPADELQRSLDKDEADLLAEQKQEKAANKGKRTYLHVPFAEKDQAKAQGARWDGRIKRWYVQPGVDLKPFTQWQTKAAVEKKAPALDPVQEFAVELRAQGVVIKGAPIMDGKWHRASLGGDEKGKENASYRGFLDGRANGQIKNYKTDELIKWVARGEALSPEDRQKLEAEAAEVREKRAAERQKLQNEARLIAMQRFDVGKVPEVDNDRWNKGYQESLYELEDMPYLARKKVGAYGIHELSSNLLVPARDVDGKLWSVQTIEHDGTKRFLKDARKAGLMHVIDPNGRMGEKPVKSQVLGKGTIIIAEGYATAASIFEATKQPTVAAFDAGNLKPVAEAIRAKYPDAKIVIAADNDHKLEGKPIGNVGVNKAIEAANLVGGVAVVPELTPDQKERGLSDWNDLTNDIDNLLGKKAVFEQISQQIKQQKKLTKTREHDRGQAVSM